MKLRRLVLIASLVVSAAAVRPAIAGTTVYQQAPDQGGGFYADQSQHVYDNFTLASTSTVNSVSWYGVPVAAAPSAFTINFYSDSGGVPGALAGSNVAASNATATGQTVLGFYPEYAYSASLSPLTFIAGLQYWVEITADTNGSWNWETGSGGDGSLLFAVPGATGFASTAGDLAFTLTDVGTSPVPEPSSFVLLGTGLLSAVGIARRRFLKA